MQSYHPVEGEDFAKFCGLLWLPIRTLSTDIQKKTGARNRISIDFDATETTKEIPTENEFNPPRASTPTRDIEQRLVCTMYVHVQ